LGLLCNKTEQPDLCVPRPLGLKQRVHEREPVQRPDGGHAIAWSFYQATRELNCEDGYAF